MRAEHTEKLQQAVSTATSIAFDGCHKIYVAMDAAETAKLTESGYGEDPSEHVPVTQTATGRRKAVKTAIEWFEDSCSLRSITLVSNNPSTGESDYEDIIGQFDYEPEWRRRER